MSFGDSASAIDDSYEPIHFHTDQRSRRASGDGAATNTYQGYNGPRSGHWTIKDSLIGSGIDDGRLTVKQIPVTNHTIPSHVQPLTGDMIQRLANATEDQKKARDENAVFSNTKFGIQHGMIQEQTPARPKLEPQGFFVPKIDGRGIRITSKDGKNEVVKQPQISLVPVKAAKEKRKQISQEQSLNDTKSQALSHLPPVKPEKAISHALGSSQKSTRAVRITSKNGEEVFTSLPIIQSVSNHASHVPSVTKQQKAEEGKIQSVREDNNDKARRDADATKAAQQLREERAVQTHIDKQRAKDAKIAAEKLMSGALPLLSRPSSSTNTASSQSAKSSAKDSGVAFDEVRSATSMAPSMLSSRTSGPLSQGAESVKLAPRSSKTISVTSSKTSGTRSQQAAAVKSTLQASGKASGKASNKQSNANQDSGWRELGVAKHDTAQSQGTHRSASVLSWQAKSATPEHAFHDTTAFKEARSETATNRSVSTNQPSYRSKQSSAPRQTIFAGQGWISPHPLSLPPSEFEKPPDPVIKIPSRNGMHGAETMTYDEWMRIQHSEDMRSEKGTHRNFSWSSSDARGYNGGSWGVGNVRVAESVQEQRSEGRYFHPAVQSVKSDGTYEHDLDGMREEDGKMRLRMPWDGQN